MNYESFVIQIENKIARKKKILEGIDKQLNKLENISAIIDLISSCIGENGHEFKNLYNSSKDDVFKSMHKEISYILLQDEKKRFPENIVELENYKNTLNKEILELKKITS